MGLTPRRASMAERLSEGLMIKVFCTPFDDSNFANPWSRPLPLASLRCFDMETFAIMGFILDMSALGMARSNVAKIKKLESKLEEFENKVREFENEKEKEK